jgi:hypothetical protein
MKHRGSGWGCFRFREVWEEGFFGDLGCWYGGIWVLVWGWWERVGGLSELGVGEKRCGVVGGDGVRVEEGFGAGGRAVRGCVFGCGVGEVGEEYSGRRMRAIPGEKISVEERCAGRHAGRVKAWTSVTPRILRCGRYPGAWGQFRYRPSSPVTGFAYDRTRRPTGVPLRGASLTSTTRHLSLAESVPQLRSIETRFGTGSVASLGRDLGR